MEEWKTCIYDGEIFDNYEVSNTGKIRSLNFNRTGKIKELKLNTKGDYIKIQLWKKGSTKAKDCLVHRLVANAFIPNDNPTEKTEVNHINENKHDNRVENLEWITPKKNVNHGTCQERKARAKTKRVRCIETGQIFDSAEQVQKELGIHKTNIQQCCRGILEKCKGLHFEYVD